MQILSVQCDFADGAEAHTRHFSLEGEKFDIDLCDAHSEMFDEMASKWIECAQRTPRPWKPRSAVYRRQTSVMREWGLANAEQYGFGQIHPYGRLPVRVREAFEQAHAA